MAKRNTFPKEITNGIGLNVKLKAYLYDDKTMRELGFTDHNPKFWYWVKNVWSYKGMGISFNLSIAKSGEFFRIDVLDDMICQPYDYQWMISQGEGRGRRVPPTAYIVRDNVEALMEELAEKHIISGHVKGEYI